MTSDAEARTRIMARWCSKAGIDPNTGDAAPGRNEYQIAGPFDSRLAAARYASRQDIHGEGVVVIQKLETFFCRTVTDWITAEEYDTWEILGM